MAAGAIRLSLDNSESNALIEKAKPIVDGLNKSQLTIVSAKSDFEQKICAFNEESDSLAPLNPMHHPSHIIGEVDAQVSFVRKLKYNFLEQQAKDKYVKTIVDDDVEIITVDDNEALRRSNEAKKARLKQTKSSLAAQIRKFGEIAEVVNSHYSDARSKTDELNKLSSQILDAHLALSRLRAAHPLPRLSVASANATLESQTEQMTMLDAQLSENASRIERLKEKLKDIAPNVERLRVERAAKEEEVRRTKIDEEDERFVALFKWYSAALDLHRSLFGIKAIKPIAENELALTYTIPAATNIKAVEPNTFTITLLFQPNTRTLADASVSSTDSRIAEMNLSDLIGIYVQSNDVRGLVRSIMGRVRAVV